MYPVIFVVGLRSKGGLKNNYNKYHLITEDRTGQVRVGQCVCAIQEPLEDRKKMKRKLVSTVAICIYRNNFRRK